MEKIGIENLKKALLVVINLGESVDKALADDGTVDLLEGIGIASKAVKIWKVAKDFLVLKEEFLDIDEDEKAELVTYFSDELDLENDVTEVIIEKAFALLINLKEFLTAFEITE